MRKQDMNCEETLSLVSLQPCQRVLTLNGNSLNPTNRAQPLITATRKQLITSQNVRPIISVFHSPSCRTNYLQHGLVVGYVYTFRYICTKIVCSQVS